MCKNILKKFHMKNVYACLSMVPQILKNEQL